MKILVIGGHGTIGRKVVAHLSKKDTVIVGGRNRGDVLVDISEASSIEAMFKEVGMVDSIVCIAGEAKWAAMAEMQEEDFYIGIRSKLMGQVNLSRIGIQYLHSGGSITLSTGILADEPVFMTTSAAMVNGGVNSFVKAAALEMKDGKRINVVSSGLVEDSAEKYADYFPGYDPVPMDKVVRAYVKSIKGWINGQVIRVQA